VINGKPCLDINGNEIHAHGGWMLRHGDYWYWYGEDRREGYYVSCYRSADLVNWEFRNEILTVDSAAEERFEGRKYDVGERRADGSLRKVNVERPKVMYHEKTGRFVLWAHFENGRDYREACACTAVCDTPDGDFVWLGSFNPCGCMSRDCTLHLDDDGEMYFISAANENRDLHIYRLTEDWLDVAEQVNILYAGQSREAPAVFKKDGKYYMITSACTGWAPNQSKWACADRIDGTWSELKPIGDETTYRSQSAFVLPLADENGVMKYYYVGDRWGGSEYFKSTYVVLEIRFDGSGEPYMDFTEESPVM